MTGRGEDTAAFWPRWPPYGKRVRGHGHIHRGMAIADAHRGETLTSPTTVEKWDMKVIEPRRPP